MREIFRFQVEETAHNTRLDKFIFGKIGFLSRIYLVSQIAEGFCLVNGSAKPGGYKISNGEQVEISIETDKKTSMTAKEMPLEILFEDEEIIVLNKPYGILVHPTTYVKGETLLNGLSFYLNHDPISGSLKNENDFIRAGLPHRLDKETSGLLVVTKTDRALRIVASHFQRKLVEKIYLAVVEGVVTENSGKIETLIGRIDDGIPRWQVTADGKPAETDFKVIERRNETTLLELKPITGRTNQLRVHCAHIGHPIIGDFKRGSMHFARLCLHAYRLNFFHPNGGRLEFACEMPEDMSRELV